MPSYLTYPERRREMIEQAEAAVEAAHNAREKAIADVAECRYKLAELEAEERRTERLVEDTENALEFQKRRGTHVPSPTLPGGVAA